MVFFISLKEIWCHFLVKGNQPLLSKWRHAGGIYKLKLAKHQGCGFENSLSAQIPRCTRRHTGIASENNRRWWVPENEWSHTQVLPLLTVPIVSVSVKEREGKTGANWRLTVVWTIMERWSLMAATRASGWTGRPALNRLSAVSNRMKAPVRPMPAEQCTSTGRCASPYLIQFHKTSW